MCRLYRCGHRLIGSRQLTLTVSVLIRVSELLNLLLQSAPAMLLAQCVTFNPRVTKVFPHPHHANMGRRRPPLLPELYWKQNGFLWMLCI